MPADRRIRALVHDGREYVAWSRVGGVTGIRQDWIAYPSKATPDVHALLHGCALLINRDVPRFRG